MLRGGWRCSHSELEKLLSDVTEHAVIFGPSELQEPACEPFLGQVSVLGAASLDEGLLDRGSSERLIVGAAQRNIL